MLFVNPRAKVVEFLGCQLADFPTHDCHVERELPVSVTREFGGFIQERAESHMNVLFIPVLPELLELLSKRGFGRLPVKDGESLVELVGTCPALELSG